MIPVDCVNERLLVAMSVMVAGGDEVVELCLQNEDALMSRPEHEKLFWQEQL